MASARSTPSVSRSAAAASASSPRSSSRSLRITAAKTRGDAQPLPLEEEIEIGLFAGEEALYLAKHALKQGTQELAIVIAKPPVYAAVDPYLTRIDRAPSDNGSAVR